MVRLIGLMMANEDPEIFGKWCSEQLSLYDVVVCLDGCHSSVTRRVALEFPDQIIYLHENQFEGSCNANSRWRGVVHDEIVRLFGSGGWIMCCHAEEFCYHDPRKIAAKAETDGYDLVSWYSPRFFWHPSEFPRPEEPSSQSVPLRLQHPQQGSSGAEFPCVVDRLYRNAETISWGSVSEDSVRPLGIQRPAPYHPILKYCLPSTAEAPLGHTPNKDARFVRLCGDQADRNSLNPFSTACGENLRSEGSFSVPWNMGDEFRSTRTNDLEHFDDELHAIQQLVTKMEFQKAESALLSIRRRSRHAHTKSIVCANLGVLDVLQGAIEDGQLAFTAAVALDRNNLVASENLSLVAPSATSGRAMRTAGYAAPERSKDAPAIRVAILSLLFNWPSTGGGTIHTKELAEQLSLAGFEVLHIFARFEGWGIGNCQERLQVPTEVLSFDELTWNLENVIARFRAAVEAYQPNYVIVTDSWNSKPWLAQAASSFPCILRYQALENLCPLNNVRLVPDEVGRPTQCGRHQLATPVLCHNCCQSNVQFSGHLHQLERQFSRVGSAEYDQILRKAISSATAVLVVNPLMQAIMSPWNERTLVVPSGMDPKRFGPISRADRPARTLGKKQILFAGLIEEYMKGFHVLAQACEHLWSKRQDFELVVTAGPPGMSNPYTRFVGWLNQQELAEQLAESDMLVFPTIAQEALGRTAVEAMGAGVPVVASRIGGLNYTVVDYYTGLLATPGDSLDLANKIEVLLEDEQLCQTFGQNGRRRFLEEYAWPVIIERHYRPLLQKTASQLSQP